MEEISRNPSSRFEVMMSLGSGGGRDEERGCDDALGELSWDFFICRWKLRVEEMMR